MPKVAHGIKMSLKTSSARNIVKADGALKATEDLLNHWHSTTSQLLQALVNNEHSWQALFASYSAFHPIAANIYPAHDNDALECVAALSSVKDTVLTDATGTESLGEATQRIDIAKNDLNNLLTRINGAKKMHTDRVTQIREAQYYKEKSDQLYYVEAKKKGPSAAKALERRERNVNKSSEFHGKVTSITNQLFHEMDAIAVERLAATDRALAALLLLQQHYFETNPISNAFDIGSRVGLGRRVLIRDESRPWLPNTPHQVEPPSVMPDQSATTIDGQVYSIPPYNPNVGKPSPQISSMSESGQSIPAEHYLPDNNYVPQTNQPGHQQAFAPTQSQQPAYPASVPPPPPPPVSAQIDHMNQPGTAYSPYPDPNAAPSSLAAPIPTASVPTQTNPAPPPVGPPMPGQSPQPIYTTSASNPMPLSSNQGVQAVQNGFQRMQISPGTSQTSVPQASQPLMNIGQSASTGLVLPPSQSQASYGSPASSLPHE